MDVDDMVIGTTYYVRYYPHTDFDRLTFRGKKWERLYSFTDCLGYVINFLRRDLVEIKKG